MSIYVTPERPLPNEYAEYYNRYVAHVPDGDICDLLERQLADTLELLAPLDEEQAGYRYAPGKWSIRQVVGHVSDAERVFAYRALRFSRHDQTALPGMDQDVFMDGANFDDRPLPDVLNELSATRQTTLALFRSMSGEMWNRTGMASGFSFTVRALAYIIAGHERYHAHLLKKRYLNHA